MILRDWRDADPAQVRACYETEARSWRDDLGWDTTWTWSTVEHARVTWGLPGRLVDDGRGQVLGWAFWLPEGPTVHLGGIVASSPEVTAMLLDDIVNDARRSDAVACFVRDRAAGLADGLAARGFSHERFLYLSRPLAPAAQSGAGMDGGSDAWNDADFPEAVALIQAAYAAEGGRHFAPNDTRTEWTKYLSELVDHRGCGEFDGPATRVVRDGGGLSALALVTTLGPDTAHLAQLVVRPDCRGRGLAFRLVSHVIESAAQAGKHAVTLLVGEGNAAARALYARTGFEHRGLFIAGRCDVAVPA